MKIILQFLAIVALVLLLPLLTFVDCAIFSLR
jgi:hypothetical protein